MAMPKLFKDIMDNRRYNVTATSATLVEGSIELVLPISIVTGSIVKFTAPCDCTHLSEGLIINNLHYDLVDALGEPVTDRESWSSGAQIAVLLDCESNKAYIQNAAIGELDTDDISHKNSVLSDVLNTQTEKLNLVISTASSGQTSTIALHEESIEDWICTEGYWNGKYISTGV